MDKVAVSVRWLANTLNRGLKSRLSGASSRPALGFDQAADLIKRIGRWSARKVESTVQDINKTPQQFPLKKYNIGKDVEKAYLTDAIRKLSGNPNAPTLVSTKDPILRSRIAKQQYRNDYVPKRKRMTTTPVKHTFLSRFLSRFLRRLAAEHEMRQLQSGGGVFQGSYWTMNHNNALPTLFHEAGHAVDFAKKRALQPDAQSFIYPLELAANRYGSQLLRVLSDTSHPHLKQMFTPKQYLNWALKRQLENYRAFTLANGMSMLDSDVIRRRPILDAALRSPSEGILNMLFRSEHLYNPRKGAAPKVLRDLHSTLYETLETAARKDLQSTS